MPKPSGHFHTGPFDLIVTTAGVLVILHAARLAAIALAKSHSPLLVGAGKIVASITLSD